MEVLLAVLNSIDTVKAERSQETTDTINMELSQNTK